jgi:hypothetical protein
LIPYKYIVDTALVAAERGEANPFLSKDAGNVHASPRLNLNTGSRVPSPVPRKQDAAVAGWLLPLRPEDGDILGSRKPCRT